MIYLKRCSQFFLALSVISLAFLCPFYYLGSLDDEKEKTLLVRITIFSTVHSNKMLWFIFLIALGYSVTSFYFIYHLVIQLKDFQPYIDKSQESDYSVSKRSIVIQGIPTSLPTQVVNELMNRSIHQRYGRDFVAASTLGSYKKLYKLCRERIYFANKLNKYLVKTYDNPDEVRLIFHFPI